MARNEQRFVASWLVLESLTILLTFYLLFYFLRDRNAILGWLREHSAPDRGGDEPVVSADCRTQSQATLYGTVAVAIVQGALGGLMFWLLGLPTPLLWGIIMGLLRSFPCSGRS